MKWVLALGAVLLCGSANADDAVVHPSLIRATLAFITSTRIPNYVRIDTDDETYLKLYNGNQLVWQVDKSLEGNCAFVAKNLNGGSRASIYKINFSKISSKYLEGTDFGSPIAYFFANGDGYCDNREPNPNGKGLLCWSRIQMSNMNFTASNALDYIFSNYCDPMQESPF